MTNKEKEIIKLTTEDIKSLYEIGITKADIIKYMDYVIVLRCYFDCSYEFMEKLYFIRNYIDKVAF